MKRDRNITEHTVGYGGKMHERAWMKIGALGKHD